jgi:AraC family transcriptional regulator
VFHLHLDQELMTAFAEEARLTPSARSTPIGDDPIIMHHAIWAFEALKEGSPSRLFWDTAAAAIGLRLLSSRDRPLPSPARGGLAPWQVKRAVAFIRDNLHRDVSLTELAGQVGLSPHHFCRAFKQSTGASPHNWLTQHRIERAQDIIAARPSAGLTEVALCVGFNSQSAFGTAFRRVTGTTPSAWRRERLS